MKKSDLHREWARVLDMCEGTKVDPVDCWKIGVRRPGIVPRFCEDLERYEFAVAILEDKPVFVGDVLYHESGSKHIIAYRPNSFEGYSWNTPKKTYSLYLSEKHIKILSGDYDKPTFKDLSDIRNLANIALKESTGNGE